MKEKYIEFEFNYASIALKPYTNRNGTSSQLLKNIIRKLNEEDYPSEERIIDRYKNRKNTAKRELVIISHRFGEQGKRCFGKIALIKNKAPLLLVGKDIIEEIEKEKNKKFIEITNFTINFNEDSDPIIMHEYNHEGPRLSDIVFYIRQIASNYQLGKNIQHSIHLKTDYEQLDRNMQNVFNVKVKVKAVYNNRFNWFKALKNLSDDSGYNDIRLELYYKRKKEKDGKYERNIRGTDFARSLLGWLKKDKINIKYLDDLKMSYQLSDSDEIYDLDFLKNKVVSFLKVYLTDGKLYKNADFVDVIGQEFNYYLNTGKTKTE